jgi:hypothetical protein
MDQQKVVKPKKHKNGRYTVKPRLVKAVLLRKGEIQNRPIWGYLLPNCKTFFYHILFLDTKQNVKFIINSQADEKHYKIVRNVK